MVEMASFHIEHQFDRIHSYQRRWHDDGPRDEWPTQECDIAAWQQDSHNTDSHCTAPSCVIGNVKWPIGVVVCSFTTVSVFHDSAMHVSTNLIPRHFAVRCGLVVRLSGLVVRLFKPMALLVQLTNLLNGGNSDLIDLNMIQDGAFNLDDPVTMAMHSNEFPMGRLIDGFIGDLRKQGVKLKQQTWQRFVNLHNQQLERNGYQNRNGPRQTGQIGLEALSLHAKLSANELYESIAGHPPETETQIRKRDGMMDSRISSVISNLLSSSFVFTLDRDSEFCIRINQFLTSETATTMLSNLITAIIQPKGNHNVTPEKIGNILKESKQYVCDELGHLKGCALRDGWLICKSRLAAKFDENEIYWASAFSSAFHEAAHFCVRANFNNYGFRSPTSGVDGPQYRMDPDPKYSKKRLELGRAAEMIMFGGLESGIQVEWENSEKQAAANFVHRVQTGALPYPNKETCLQLGMAEREAISLSFAGDFINLWPQEL